MKYKQEIKTKSHFVNRFGELSTSFLFWQMQDIAWEHAEKLGIGFNNLHEHQQLWVLSRMLLKIKRRPKWGEKFTLETWPVGLNGLLAIRDLHFIDANGESIIKATTSWLILDLNTRKVIRLDASSLPSHNARVMNENAGKVQAAKSNEELSFSPVLFDEIDINQHFNSGSYLARIINSYNFAFHEKNELAELEVNFVKEGMPDDKLGVKCQILDKNTHICSVVRESDGADLIRARLVWIPKQ